MGLSFFQSQIIGINSLCCFLVIQTLKKNFCVKIIEIRNLFQKIIEAADRGILWGIKGGILWGIAILPPNDCYRFERPFSCLIEAFGTVHENNS